MALDPVATSHDITERYLTYLKTAYFIKNNEIRERFYEALSGEKFSKGPILEVTPPFLVGSSLKQLIDEGVLSTEFHRLNPETLPPNLYKHQETAIRNIVQEGKNIIAATGTGSGKTEIYLISILNALMRENEAGTLGPGVRALLLYPMNALVNDQLKRMRELLKNYPDITFGKYTGETEEEQKKAAEIHFQEYGEKPQNNELISREVMRKTPPHILLTNYAMLEFLLLRPMDIDLFEGANSGNWSFLVLDEIHTYTGAKGIETALLMRRLKERVIVDKSKKFQCIGTSATLAGERRDYPAVVQFAKDIFGEHFDEVDIIVAERAAINPSKTGITLPSDLYGEWAEYLTTEPNPEVSYFVKSLQSRDISEDLIQTWLNQTDNSIEAFLYVVLQQDYIVQKLLSYLKENETPFFEATAHYLFPESEHVTEITAALISLAVRAKHSSSEFPLIPARYHFFIRAIEGAYIAFTPKPVVVTEPTREIITDSGTFRAFEIGVCKECGALYLIGAISKEHLDHPLIIDEKYEPSQYFLFQNDYHDEADGEDEDNTSDNTEKAQEEEYILCSKCGRIQRSTSMRTFCDCGKKFKVYVYKTPSIDSKVHKCRSCYRTTSRGSMVHRVIAGQDAIGSVLVTELYDHIPPKLVNFDRSAVAPTTNPDWTVGPLPPTQRTDGHYIESRKLLVFSDSRQDAAFFAPYLNRTYHQVQRKAILFATLQKHKERAKQKQWQIKDLVTPVIQEISHYDICETNRTAQEIDSVVWKWLLQEFFTYDQRLNLEQLGLLWFSPKKPDNFGIPFFEKDPWYLNPEEIWGLIKIFLNTLRKSRIVKFPDSVMPEDEFFAPQNAKRYIRMEGSIKHPKISAWCPSEKYSNSRLDYLIRLANRLKIPESKFNKEQGRDILKNIWKFVLVPERPLGMNQGFFEKESIRGHGVVYQLNLFPWEIGSLDLDTSTQWYKCDTCHHLTRDNIRGVCPTYRCPGTLKTAIPSQLFQNNHYYQLYTTLEPKRFRAEEHTAQLKKAYARKLQSKFIHGEIDILCCSTTFELGVDVGELETVFLKNVPPTPANYIQRAGRAGRRTNSTAFCLTLCQIRSHDLHHFAEPDRMVRGKILPPHFSIENEKIVRRHLTAMILSSFWKIHPETFGNVQSFFFQNDKPGPELLWEFLHQKPTSLLTSLKKVTPPELAYLLEDVDGEWRITLELFNPKNGVIHSANLEIKNDIKQLKSLRQIRADQGKKADYILNIINTFLSRKIIDYLATHNVLPKYGFPVDIVELAIYSNAGKNLDLTRDLKIALSEYAPGGEVVAAGKIWTSRYVKQLPHKGLEEKFYVICSKCKRYYTSLEGKLPAVCIACGNSLNNRKFLTIPEFGFISDSKEPKKSFDKRPEKTYSTRVFYASGGEGKEPIPLPLPDGYTILRATSDSNGKFGVINSGKIGFGFKICNQCGYAILGNEDSPDRHENPYRQQCIDGEFRSSDLGHEFRTDMAKLVFEHSKSVITEKEGFWHSLLYALLDGTSDRLDIERNDIDGCIYFEEGHRTALVLFDSVPGGAGHVKRLVTEEGMLIEVLKQTYKNLNRCQCGGVLGDSSCYSCLKNYYNQYYHSVLKRGPVIQFLGECLGEKGN